MAISSSRESVVTSNAAKCSRSCAGVTMPAWWVPRKAYAFGPVAGVTASSALARPATNAPATPAAATPPPRMPRREIPVRTAPPR
jgi:hypothetical protein